MNRELQNAAAVAWAAMLRPDTPLTRLCGNGPMSVGIALDFVQNVTGERDDAVTALLGAAADWLDTQTVPSGDTEIDAGSMDDRGLIASYIRQEGLGMALVFLGHIRSRCEGAAHPMAASAEKWSAAQWQSWANKAAFAIALCRAVIEAAYPETPAGA